MKKSGYIAKYIFNQVERLIDGKMGKAKMGVFETKLEDTSVEYWDNRKNLPVIVLLHGFGATTKYQWFKQVEILSENYRLILPNLIHFGRTVTKKENISLADQVQMVEQLLVHLQVEEFILMGISYGGLVGIELTQKERFRIKQLIIIDSPIKFMLEEDIAMVCQRFKVKSVEELFVPESPKGLKKLWHLSSGKKIYLPDFIFTEFYNRMYAGNKESKRKLMQNLISSLKEFSAHEYTFKVRTILIWGDDDLVVPVQRGRLLNQYLANSEMHIIKKGGHMVNLNKAEEFNQILQKVLL